MRWLMVILLLLLIPCVTANEIRLGLNQTDYHYQVKESAHLPLEIENTYGRTIVGNLSVSVAQRMEGLETRWSGEVSHSREFQVNPGKNIIDLGFGEADTPILLKVDFKIVYENNKSVELFGAVIHYVAEKSGNESFGLSLQASSGIDESDMLRTLEMFGQFVELEDLLISEGFELDKREFVSYDNSTLIDFVYKNGDISERVEVWFVNGAIISVNRLEAEQSYWLKVGLWLVLALFIWVWYRSKKVKKIEILE